MHALLGRKMWMEVARKKAKKMKLMGETYMLSCFPLMERRLKIGREYQKRSKHVSLYSQYILLFLLLPQAPKDVKRAKGTKFFHLLPCNKVCYTNI